MKKIPLILCLLATSWAVAQETSQSSVQSSSTESDTLSQPQSTPESKSDSGQSNPNGVGGLPLNLGSLTSADNNAILSVLNNQNSLVDLSGQKIDDAQERLVRARFEKYLNSPPSTTADDITYNQLLVDISQRLAGKGGGTDGERTLDAWRMLFKAENYSMDDQLCRTIADKVINFWQTSKKIRQLMSETADLESDRERRESKARSIASMDRQDFISMMRGSDATPPPTREYELDPIKKRLTETEAKIEENKSYEVTSRLNQKMDFQSLIVQFFVQRRYYHALIANDFYRYIFAAEDGKLEGLDSLKSQVFGGVDIKLTTSTIDALCKEAINDTDRAIKATEYLISKGEFHSATQRLLEAFFVGENLAPVKTFPMESKRAIMKYMRDTDKLINAVKVKHVERAEEVLKEIQSYTNDFDSGQVEAFIQTSRQLSDLALQKALVAAQTKNQASVEIALQEAVKFWPTNPKIQEFLKTMIGRVDLKDVASTDFDRLLSQKDFRGIFNDRFRYAAALAMDDSRNKEFLEIMKQMEIIETSIGQAKELSRLKNSFAAWEVIEKVYAQFPNDQELNKMRSDLTIKASEFASALSKARDAYASGKKWESLLAYLKAKDIYPMSSFANDEIAKVSQEILKEN